MRLKLLEQNNDIMHHCIKFYCWVLVGRIVSSIIFFDSIVSDPDCQLNQTITNDTVSLKDELQMWCTVEFRGNWSPSMQWEKSSGRVITTGVSSSIISRHQTQSNVTSNISTQILTSTLRLQPSSVEKDGIRFSCVTYFEKHSQRNILARPGSTPADKNPNYTHTWTSPVIYGECRY